MKEVSEDELIKLTYCCGILEERVAEAYRHLSERVEEPLPRILLNYIANDSRKHAELLRSMAGILGAADLDPEECGHVAGELWTKTMKAVEAELAQEEKVSGRKLASMISSLAELETVFMEEYFMMIQSEAIKLLLKTRSGAETLEKILNWITEDERRHAQILEALTSK